MAGRSCLALMRSGIGLERAREAGTAIERLRPSIVLHIGFVGALRAGLGAGDLLLVSGTSPDHHTPRSTTVPAPDPTEPELVEALRPALARLPDRLAQGAILTVDRFVHRAERKVELGAAGRYLACEMEASALRAAADRAGALYAAVRAVSDSSDHDMPPPLRGDGGRLELGRAVRWGLRPGAHRDLLRLLSGGRRAAQTLDRAVPVAVEALLGGAR